MNLKREFVHRVQRFVVNPIGRQLPMTMLETIGRKTGQPRRTAVGGRVVDNQFWMVSEHGEHSDYVYNIKANPAVRVRIGGRWRSGTAYLLPDDDPRQARSGGLSPGSGQPLSVQIHPDGQQAGATGTTTA